MIFIVIRRITSYQTNNFILLANQLIDYVPQEVEGDIYYNLISKDIILEICYGNKALMANIQNKKHLQLEDYQDTLNAVGYMMFDYCKDKVTDYYNKFMQEYSDYTFDNDNVLDVILGKETQQKFDLWNLKHKSDGFHLLGFKYRDNNIVAFNGSCGNIKIEQVYCIQIGNAKLFISDCDKKVYCRSADKDLFYIKEIKHKYKNFRRVA